MKVRFASPAERELKEAVEFYESAQEGLGADEILIVSVMDLRRDPKRWEQYL